MTTVRRTWKYSSRANQCGVVLFIALIVLVAMTLAGIGLIRSIDTSSVVSGNLAFKQAAIQSADRGTDAAYAWINTNAGTAILDTTDTARGYLSSVPVTEPDWSDGSNWANAFPVNAGAVDIAGNRVSYLVHRMCSLANTPSNGKDVSGVPNQCAFKTSGAGAGCSKTDPDLPCAQPLQIYYRITARAVGPRSTTSVIQSTIYR